MARPSARVILRPGDLIQVGTVQIKFDPGIKRPKLLAPEKAPVEQTTGALKIQATTGTLYYQTLKLPSTPARPTKTGQAKDNSAYVKGESAISYNDLATPEVKKRRSLLLIVGAVVVLVIIAAAGYYFFFLPHGAH